MLLVSYKFLFSISSTSYIYLLSTRASFNTILLLLFILQNKLYILVIGISISLSILMSSVLQSLSNIISDILDNNFDCLVFLVKKIQFNKLKSSKLLTDSLIFSVIKLDKTIDVSKSDTKFDSS